MGASVPSEMTMQIAFLTGQSDPARCALSAEQDAFLQQLRGPGRQLVDGNYPYRCDNAPYQRTPLWRASVSNAGQYLAARAARVADADRTRVATLLERTPLTVLLAGSCGLQLLTALQLPQAIRARLAVFAYGPVCSAPASFGQLRLVQGRADWISRALFAGTVDLAPACGHMDYLREATVLADCKRFIAGIEQAGQASVHAH
ncbi:hypothetical protein [Xanthomonas sp. 3058]|uniref:hypothetical protein n=1 Tax=Xanthomonas sp. 3058 TaxID=3035314 RepID=UPI001617CD00|nr:hypothetical protein [Xanthomonas sp. 3058]